MILSKAIKKPQIKWLVIVRKRVNAVRLELNLVVAKLRCGKLSIYVFIIIINFILFNTLRKKIVTALF
jgi:hypothetical protein